MLARLNSVERAASPRSPRGGTSDGEMSSSAPGASRAPSFDAFLNEQLKRGLSGLVSLRACLFVWDQAFIVGFGAMLPIVTVSLLLGAAEELRGLTTLRAAIETFASYCASVSVETLQRLMSQHCEKELRDVFDAGTSYRLQLGDNDALQAVHKAVLAGAVILP